MLTATRSAGSAWSNLQEVAQIIEPKSTNREDFIAECKSGDLDGVVVAYRTFASFRISGRIDNEILYVLPKSLKFICHNGKTAGAFQ